MHSRVRSISGQFLVGLGVALIVAAAMIRLYAYPQLAVVPNNITSDTDLQVTGAMVFDKDTLAGTETNLSIHSHTIANSQIETPDGVVVWRNSTAITLDNVDGAACTPEADFNGCLQVGVEELAFGDQSGAGVVCAECGAHANVYNARTGESTDIPIADDGAVYEGAQIYKFPFNTQKKDYQQWDGTLGKSTTATYEGETKVEGLKVYKFVQEIPATDITESTAKLQLPASAFGASGTGLVTPTVMYAVTRTFYIEPVTGAPVNRVEDRNQYFEYGGKQIPQLQGTIQYTPDQVAASVKDGTSQAFLLGGMRLLFPMVMVLLGLIAIAGGVLLRRGRKETDTPTEKRELVTA